LASFYLIAGVDLQFCFRELLLYLLSSAFAQQIPYHLSRTTPPLLNSFQWGKVDRRHHTALRLPFSPIALAPAKPAPALGDNSVG